MIASPEFPAPGTEVGCSYRWPGNAFHPDCWERPHKGIVLALDDPRAWKETLAFPREAPQDKVTAHVEKCMKDGLLLGRVPVLWVSSCDNEVFMQWDSKLRPYAEELAAWETARAAAYEMEQGQI